MGFNSHVSIHRASSTSSRSYSLEQIRDFLRRRLGRVTTECAFGQYTSANIVMDKLLTCSTESTRIITKSVRFCQDGHAVDHDERIGSSCEIATVGPPAGYTVQRYIDDFSVALSSSCPECGNTLFRQFSFACHPPLLAVELWEGLGSLDTSLRISVDGGYRRYSLRGVIYFAADHFTARIVTQAGMVWFHDGIFTGSSLVYESANILSIPTADSVTAIYTRENSDMPYGVVAR